MNWQTSFAGGLDSSSPLPLLDAEDFLEEEDLQLPDCYSVLDKHTLTDLEDAELELEDELSESLSSSSSLPNTASSDRAPEALAFLAAIS